MQLPWIKHQHQHNKAYDNLILHVVYEHDVELPQNELYNVSVLELKTYIKPALLEKYNHLQQATNPIACGKSITTVPDIIWKTWLDRLAITRIEQKTSYIQSLFDYCNHDYENTLYLLLVRYFGFKINNDAFEMLAKSLSISIIKKHQNQPLQVEALLFGCAGLLQEPFKDEYPTRLQNEYEFLKHKYQLIPLQKEIWKFSKTRPVNFPTIRIAQLAALFSNQVSLFHLIESKTDLKKIKNYFTIEVHSYWQNHFLFDNEVTSSNKTFGEEASNSIVINVIIPFLGFMAIKQSKDELMDYALELLTQLPSEKNTKTKAYTSLGIINTSALDSQAEIQLYDHYCTKKACLTCHVGQALLKNSK